MKATAIFTCTSKGYGKALAEDIFCELSKWFDDLDWVTDRNGNHKIMVWGEQDDIDSLSHLVRTNETYQKRIETLGILKFETK